MFNLQVRVTKSQGNSKPGPSFGAGTGSRKKVKYLEKYPSKTLSQSKLPKTESVFLSLIANIQNDEESSKHPNSMTLMTDRSIKEAAKTVCGDIKAVWRNHFSSALIDGSSEERIIQSDTMILRNLNKLVQEWKDLERLERRTDRQALFDKKLKDWKEKMKLPMDISKANADEIIDKSKIIEKEAEKIHLKQQLSIEQPGTVAGLDKRQQKRDLRAKKSQESFEKRWKEARNNNQQTEQPADEIEEDSNEEEDEEGEYKSSSSRPRKRKINIVGPISLAADGRGLSIRDRTVLAAESVKAAGIDVQDTNISVGSAYYHAKKSRVEVSKKVQEEFQCPDHVSVHWDSKMVDCFVFRFRNKTRENLVFLLFLAKNAQYVG